MSGPTLDSLFELVQQSAFRWEGRSIYAVGGAEQERIEAWRQHRPRPERSIRTNPYLARIARQTLAGATWQRVTRRHSPPTEYQRYRTAGDLESQAAGEQVLVLLDDVRLSVGDFWLFDYGSTWASAAMMRYMADGAFDGFEVVNDLRVLDSLNDFRVEVTALAIPLNVYLAEQERIGA